MNIIIWLIVALLAAFLYWTFNYKIGIAPEKHTSNIVVNSASSTAKTNNFPFLKERKAPPKAEPEPQKMLKKKEWICNESQTLIQGSGSVRKCEFR